ncbi:hypothetical protein [Thermoleptolyngbya sp.]
MDKAWGRDKGTGLGGRRFPSGWLRESPVLQQTREEGDRPGQPSPQNCIFKLTAIDAMSQKFPIGAIALSR